MGIVPPAPGSANMSAGPRSAARGRVERAASQVGPWHPGVAPWASALASALPASAQWGPVGAGGCGACLMSVPAKGARPGGMLGASSCLTDLCQVSVRAPVRILQ